MRGWHDSGCKASRARGTRIWQGEFTKSMGGGAGCRRAIEGGGDSGRRIRNSGRRMNG